MHLSRRLRNIMLLSNRWQEPSDINDFSRARFLLLDSEGESLRTGQNTFARLVDRWVVDLTEIGRAHV